MTTFKCPSCDDDIEDNGMFSCGCCLRCGIFFHNVTRLLPRSSDRVQPQAARPDDDFGAHIGRIGKVNLSSAERLY